MTSVRLVPGHVDYNYGYCHLQLLTQLIPRAIWPDKIYPHSEAFTPLFKEGGLSGTYIRTAKRRDLLMGPAFSFVGHWHAVGGLAAVALGGFLTGIILRAIRSILDRNPLNQSAMILYAHLIIIGFGEAAATPLGWAWTLPFVILAILIAVRAAGERSRGNMMPAPPGAPS
jgi:hypothetical protein